MSDADLERALADLGRRLDYPPTPDLAGAVRARLLAQPARRRGWGALRRPGRRSGGRWPGRRWPSWLLAGGLLLLSPDARRAVAERLGLPGVTIQYLQPPTSVIAPVTATPLPGSQPPPTLTQPSTPLQPPPTALPSTPTADRLGLGERLPALADARSRVAYPVLAPTLPELAIPDEVYLGTPPAGGQVALVYRPRPGLPAAPETGVGLLFTQFRGTLRAGVLRQGAAARALASNRSPWRAAGLLDRGAAPLLLLPRPVRSPDRRALPAGGERAALGAGRPDAPDRGGALEGGGAADRGLRSVALPLAALAGNRSGFRGVEGGRHAPSERRRQVMWWYRLAAGVAWRSRCPGHAGRVRAGRRLGRHHDRRATRGWLRGWTDLPARLHDPPARPAPIRRRQDHRSPSSRRKMANGTPSEVFRMGCLDTTSPRSRSHPMVRGTGRSRSIRSPSRPSGPSPSRRRRPAAQAPGAMESLVAASPASVWSGLVVPLAALLLLGAVAWPLLGLIRRRRLAAPPPPLARAR